MKRYFGIIVAVIFVVVAIVWASRKWTTKETESQREQQMLKLRADALERVAFVRDVPDEKAYREEMASYLRWYFKGVNEHLNRFNGNRNFDDYLVELEDRKAKKPAKETEYEQPSRSGDKSGEKKAMFEYVKKDFDDLRSGNYNPYWTGVSSGIRLDIMSASTARIGGDEKIHMPVIVWGLPREDKTDDKGVRTVRCNASFRFNWKLFDEKQKLIAEIPGEGGPDNRVEWPERYIKYFPPNVLIGHYDVDKVPAEAKTAEINWTISGRAPTGGDYTASYNWKIDVPAEWKLTAGETWKGAQESIRPEEEIDPAKANPPGKKK